MINVQYLMYVVTLGFMACQNPGGANKGDSLKQEVLTSNSMESNGRSREIKLLVSPNVFKLDDANKMLKYIVDNPLDSELIIDSFYSFERLAGDKWQVVPFVKNLVFEDITYVAPSQGSKEFILALSKILEDKGNVKGRYRLIKEVWPYGKEKEKTLLKAEFEIR